MGRDQLFSGPCEGGNREIKQVMTMLDMLKEIAKTVNSRIEVDSDAKELMEAKDRTIVLIFTDLDKSYILSIKGGKMEEPHEGTIESPTLTVTTDKETMTALIEKKLNPLMAYAMRKIKIEGPIDEVMVMKDFF